MKHSIIKKKLSADEPAMLVCAHLTDPSVHELISLMGFDGIFMDMEHHCYSLETASALMRVVRLGGSDVVARPAKGEFMRLGRMLEAGAQGIAYPRCDNAEEAAEVVKWAKFPPMGQRGADGGNPDMPYCTMPYDQYIRAANEQTFVVIQLEDPKAVDNAEAIAAVEGVDVLMFGPGDYSVQIGLPGEFESAAAQSAIERIAKAARNTGKHWGTPCGSVARASEVVRMGARLVIHQADIMMIKYCLERIQAEFEPVGFSFSNRLLVDNQRTREE